MPIQTYQGYFKDGCFYVAGQKVDLPDGRRVQLIISDEREDVANDKHAKAWQEFLRDIKTVTNEPLPEFERVHFREVKE